MQASVRTCLSRTGVGYVRYSVCLGWAESPHLGVTLSAIYKFRAGLIECTCTTHDSDALTDPTPGGTYFIITLCQEAQLTTIILGKLLEYR